MKFSVLKVSFTQFAFAELEDAREYYNLEQAGVGDRFWQDVKEAVDRIATSPKIYPVVRDNIRKSVLHRFPYTVFYVCFETQILILAVASHYREPFYWVKR